MNDERKAILETFAREVWSQGHLLKGEIEQMADSEGLDLSEEEITVVWLSKLALEGNGDALSLMFDYASGRAFIE